MSKRILIPADQRKIFDKIPKNRPPFSEIAAVQTFKLMGWATATAGIYLLQSRTSSFGLSLIPYLLALLIVWDMSSKFAWWPHLDESGGDMYMTVSLGWALKLAAIMALSTFTAWAVIFWLAPLIHVHVLAHKLT